MVNLMSIQMHHQINFTFYFFIRRMNAFSSFSLFIEAIQWTIDVQMTYEMLCNTSISTIWRPFHVVMISGRQKERLVPWASLWWPWDIKSRLAKNTMVFQGHIQWLMSDIRVNKKYPLFHRTGRGEMGRREQKGESNHFSLGLSLLPSDEVKKTLIKKRGDGGGGCQTYTTVLKWLLRFSQHLTSMTKAS